MNLVQKIMQGVLFSCEKAVFLIDLEESDSLNLFTRLRLKMHTGICKSCLFYLKQSQLISKMMVKIRDNSIDNKIDIEHKCLCDKSKAAMQEKLDEEINKKR